MLQISENPRHKGIVDNTAKQHSVIIQFFLYAEISRMSFIKIISAITIRITLKYPRRADWNETNASENKEINEPLTNNKLVLIFEVFLLKHKNIIAII